jgi:hypothetical protein
MLLRVVRLPALLCVCSTAACFNPPDTPLTGEVSTTDVGVTTTGIDPDTSSSSTEPATTVDPDTTIGPPDSTSTDTGATTIVEGPPEIEVSIDGMAIASGDAFVLTETVAVDDVGGPVTVTVENTGTGDLLIGGVLAMGPNADQVTIDQGSLAATIAPGESSDFTVALSPTSGGQKDLLLSIANDDDDESPYEIALLGHTLENTYRLITTNGSPSPRFNAALEDLQDGRLLLFGGRDATGAWLDDTWIYEVETATWTQLAPPTSPPARNAHAMALVGAFVVMFGGTNSGGGVPGMGDTWLYEVAAENWAMLATPMAPSGRFQHEMVALGDGRALLFGGRTTGGGTELGDTWIFDIAAGNWMDALPGGAPSIASAYALAFDGDDTVTRFGGFQNSNPIAETWNYTVSTNTWANAVPMGSPGARAVLSGEYLANGQLVVFSGKLDSCCIDPSPGTFSYDRIANTWTTITPPGEPSPRFNYAMAPVQGANKAILFGGLLQNTGVGTAQGQTWEYVGIRP